MSVAHTSRLESIRGEYAASKAALNHFRGQSKPEKVAASGVSYAAIELAQQNLEDTYFLRLTAEAEKICREHLRAHLPTIPVDRGYGYDRLLGKAARNLDPTKPEAKIAGWISADARNLRPHRNNQAHGLPLVDHRPGFLKALEALSRFVYQLP
jgi:hypothetical protein